VRSAAALSRAQAQASCLLLGPQRRRAPARPKASPHRMPPVPAPGAVPAKQLAHPRGNASPAFWPALAVIRAAALMPACWCARRAVFS